MEAKTFDALLRRAAQHATRRGALGAIAAAGAALLAAPDPGGANKQAKRRKKRKKTQKQGILLKPIGLWLDNTAGTTAVTLHAGDNYGLNCCAAIPNVTVGAGQRAWVGFRRATPFYVSTEAYIWIGGADPAAPKYWLSFYNGHGLPMVYAVADGQYTRSDGAGWCCFAPGQNVLSRKELNVNEQVNATIAGKTFNVRRNKDTNYKVFTVTLPSGL